MWDVEPWRNVFYLLLGSPINYSNVITNLYLKLIIKLVRAILSEKRYILKARWRHWVGVSRGWRKSRCNIRPSNSTTTVIHAGGEDTEAADRPAHTASIRPTPPLFRLLPEILRDRGHDSEPEPLGVRRSHHQQQWEVTLAAVAG